MKGGAIVEKDMLGNVTQLDSKGLTSAWGTISAVTGLLLPGHAALAAEVEEHSTLPVDEAIRKHGGVVFRHPMNDVVI